MMKDEIVKNVKKVIYRPRFEIRFHKWWCWEYRRVRYSVPKDYPAYYTSWFFCGGFFTLSRKYWLYKKIWCIDE